MRGDGGVPGYARACRRRNDRFGPRRAAGLGLALLILPVIGLWAMIATLRAGFAYQRLARLIAEDGLDIDASALPRRASGRIQRDAADALFAAVRTELEDDADDWRRWYRLARAYDYAGIGAARGKR